MGTNTPHTCIPGLVWQKQARRFSQFEFKVGELRFPIHFVCVSAALYHRGVRGRHFPLRWIWPIRRRCEVQKIVRTQSYDAKILPAASYLDAGRRIRDRGRSVDTYIYISWQKAKSTRNWGARLRLAPMISTIGKIIPPVIWWDEMFRIIILLRWFGTVLGRTKCANFFVKTYCLWHKQLETEIILGDHRAPFFRKWVRTLPFSTFLSMEWMGKQGLACL